jgi:DNA-binding transcriptional MerR regulator
MARMAGVSVRTLHHYDQIGLLKPNARTASGYRLYSEEDALRLQQILFFRELGFALGEIQRVLADPGFDPREALRNHRAVLQERAKRLATLMNTIDRTLEHLLEGTMPLADEEMYEGFTKEQIVRYKKEVDERYDPALVKESEQRVRRMSKPEWIALKAEGESITRELAGLADRPPEDAEVQNVIGRHFAMIGKFYTITKDIYRGLGQMYVEHDEFRAHYEKFRPGLALFLRDAMEYYCEHSA